MDSQMLQDMLVGEMRTAHNAATQARRRMPDLEQKAASELLRDAFQQQARQIDIQIQRLTDALDLLDQSVGDMHSAGMEGILSEMDQGGASSPSDDPRDLALTVIARKATLYQIASYAATMVWASTLGLDEIAALLKETLIELRATDAKLGEMAEQPQRKLQPIS